MRRFANIRSRSDDYEDRRPKIGPDEPYTLEQAQDYKYVDDVWDNVPREMHVWRGQRERKAWWCGMKPIIGYTLSCSMSNIISTTESMMKPVDNLRQTYARTNHSFGPRNLSSQNKPIQLH